jgi:hypothetical protein
MDGLVFGPTNPPSLAGFQTFITNIMRVPANCLPSGTPIIQYALDQALAIVNLDLGLLPSVPGSWSPYALAVYNLAGHLLIEYAPDQSWPIFAASWTNSFATITTNGGNGVLPGDLVAVSGVSPVAYDAPTPPSRGPIVVNAVLDEFHFTYGLSPNPGPGVAGPGAMVAETFFQRARVAFKINQFTPGVVGSASDVSTSVGIDNPDFMKGLTLLDLQLMKTPQGLAYLRIAQQYGSTIWGLS